MGLDTTSPLSVMREGYVRTAMNGRPGLFGGYDKRGGYANKATSVWTGRSIIGGIEYESSAGTTSIIVYGVTASAASGIIGSFEPSAVTNIITGLSHTARPHFVQFDDLLFFFNGEDTPQVYDGTAARQVGITTPIAAPTFSSENNTGSLVPLSAYIGAYTYYNSDTGAESTPSPVSAAHTLTGANDAIVWSVTAGDSSTADTIRFYRTYANGNALYLDGTAAIGATSYTSTVADAGLGRPLELDNSRITDLTSTANYPTVADSRIFLKSADNEIRWSKIGQEGPLPESFEAKSFVPCVGRFGTHDKIIGTNRINQLPIILKERSIGRLDPIGLPDSTVSRDNVSYQYREISDTVGAVSHEAAVQVLGELVFIGRDGGIYATDGINVRSVADAIDATLGDLGFTATQRPKLSAINDTENQVVLFQVFASAVASTPNVVLVGDYRHYPEFRWTTYEPGPVVGTHPGIKAGCYFNVTNATSGKLDVYFGNIALNGKLYCLGEGDDDDGSGIYFKIVTRPYFAGNPLTWKLFKKAEIQTLGSGNDYDLTVGAIYDLSGSEEDLTPVSLFSEGALYDDPGSLYDTSTYADTNLKIVEYHPHRKAKYMQLIFQQTEADAPVSLYSWGTYASAFGPNTGPRR
jgi:hypothetical protein